jgi:exosome complex RNA-binding protein Rrp42 (RNase PH superfamily)
MYYAKRSTNFDLTTDSNYCWFINVDLVITSCDGYPLDACSIAVAAALETCSVPLVSDNRGSTGVPMAFQEELIRLPPESSTLCSSYISLSCIKVSGVPT